MLLRRRCLMPAINKSGQTQREGRGEDAEELISIRLRPPQNPLSSVHQALSPVLSFFSMALDPVPSYPSDSNRATRAQRRVRKDERTWTTETYAPYDDGHQWRKYGEKKLCNSNFPRFYYRCTYKNDLKCPATKQVQQKDTNDPPLFSVTYFNHHTCNSSSRPIGSSPDTPAQSSSRKAVSICFNSHTTSEQPTFLTSSTTLRSPSIQSYRADQQPDSSTSYTRQFQWADASSSTSNAPVKMEADDFAETSASSNTTTSALSRTLVPIGQSRCIEYFHFL